MIYAIVTLLDEDARKKIHGILQKSSELLLDEQDINFTHISWIVSEKMDVPGVERELKKLARRSSIIKIQSGGLGVFTGENPALVLNFTRNEMATKRHKQIWEKCSAHLGDVKPYSTPDYWMPHVTLMHSNMHSKANIDLLLDRLYKPISMEICLDNLAILFRDEKNSGMLNYCQFSMECQNEEYSSKIR